MNAGTGLVAIVSLLLALAAAGGAAKEQAGVDSPTGTRSTASRVPDRGSSCPSWGCGENHNETLVSDATSVQQADTLSQWLASVQAFVFASFTNDAPVRGRCEDWGCGTNHNETFVQDAVPTPQVDTWSLWMTRVQAFFTTRPRPDACEEWGCGSNHNETLMRDAAR